MTITTVLGMAASVSFVFGISAVGVMLFGTWAYEILHEMH